VLHADQGNIHCLNSGCVAASCGRSNPRLWVTSHKSQAAPTLLRTNLAARGPRSLENSQWKMMAVDCRGDKGGRERCSDGQLASWTKGNEI